MTEQVERIASLETTVDIIKTKVDHMDTKLDMLIEAHNREQYGREVVQTVGRWTIWVIIMVAGVLHWDTVEAWFKTMPTASHH